MTTASSIRAEGMEGEAKDNVTDSEKIRHNTGMFQFTVKHMLLQKHGLQAKMPL